MIDQDKIKIALRYFDKGYDYEDLRYGDDLYNEEYPNELANEIWEYVEELKRIGTEKFNWKYSHLI